MPLDPIARLRRFNRAVTREVGALDTSFLGRGRPLGMARVLQLVRPEGTDVARIRDRLDLDSGLLSRFLRSLESEGLIQTETDPTDRRRRIARLTPKGRPKWPLMRLSAMTAPNVFCPAPVRGQTRLSPPWT